MGQTPDDIKHEVEQARARLGHDLNQLEYRVRGELDWRVPFEPHPRAFVGAAFGVALAGGVATAPGGER